MRLFGFGAGEHGRVIANSLEAGGCRVSAFLDDASGGRMSGRWEVVLAKDGLQGSGTEVALGVGQNDLRSEIYGRIVAAGAAV